MLEERLAGLDPGEHGSELRADDGEVDEGLPEHLALVSLGDWSQQLGSRPLATLDITYPLEALLDDESGSSNAAAAHDPALRVAVSSCE